MGNLIFSFLKPFFAITSLVDSRPTRHTSRLTVCSHTCPRSWKQRAHSRGVPCTVSWNRHNHKVGVAQGVPNDTLRLADTNANAWKRPDACRSRVVVCQCERVASKLFWPCTARVCRRAESEVRAEVLKRELDCSFAALCAWRCTGGCVSVCGWGGGGAGRVGAV